MQRERTAQARRLFMQYGFVPSYTFKLRSPYQSYRVFDEVNNKFLHYQYNTFLRDIKSGKVKPVDPFLHTLRVAAGPASGAGHTSVDKLQRYRDYFPIEVFKQEKEAVQSATMAAAKDMKAKANPKRPQPIRIDRTNDDDKDKANIYALIDTLYIISNFNWGKVKICLDVYFHVNNPVHDFHFPERFYINKETVAMLENLIKNLFYGEEVILLDDSDKYILKSLNEWEYMILSFEEDTQQTVVNRLENPNMQRAQNIRDNAGGRRGGAKWAWLNTTPIDLSRYGIFQKYDGKNYRYPCFVWSLEQSGILNVGELEYVKSIINTRTFPIDNVQKICKQLDISISIYYYSKKHKNVYLANECGTNTTRSIKLLLREKHYMLYEDVNICAGYIKQYKYIDEHIRKQDYDRRHMVRKVNNTGIPTYAAKPININQVIDLFFECKYFKPLTPFQLSQALFQKRDINFDELSYPACCAKEVGYAPPERNAKKVVFTSDIDTVVAENPGIRINKYKGTIRTAHTDDIIYKNSKIWFTFDNPTNDELARFKQIMESRFCVNIDDFDSTAAIGQELMHKYGCFKSVYALSGKPAIFITNCAPKITVAPAFGQKQDVSGELCSIDKNGSYTSIYRDFNGIPCGKPKVITEFTPDKYDDYYIYVNIESMTCKHKEERFPTILTFGYHFLSKTVLENLLKHYDMEYTFISGYYFDEGFNCNIRNLANDLYGIREELKVKNDRINDVFKSILNTLWGKCTYKPKNMKNVTRTIGEDSDKFLNVNYDYIYKSKPINETSVTYAITKPLSLEYGIPQFSTSILSYSRSFMNDVYFKAADMDIPIYYSNTDCCLMDKANIYKLGIVGDKLGEFKIEHDNISRAIIISPKKFIHIYSDGRPARCVWRYKTDDDEYNLRRFVQMYNK